jgi:hypothetical protein
LTQALKVSLLEAQLLQAALAFEYLLALRVEPLPLDHLLAILCQALLLYICGLLAVVAHLLALLLYVALLLLRLLTLLNDFLSLLKGALLLQLSLAYPSTLLFNLLLALLLF